jgi:hypothetical protein
MDCHTDVRIAYRSMQLLLTLLLRFCWGLVMTLMCRISSVNGLYAARFFLGLSEVLLSMSLP